MKLIYHLIYNRLTNYFSVVLFCCLSAIDGSLLSSNRTTANNSVVSPPLETINQGKVNMNHLLTTRITYDLDPVNKISIKKDFLKNLSEKELAYILISRYATVEIPKEIIFFIRQYINPYIDKTIFRSPSLFTKASSLALSKVKIKLKGYFKDMIPNKVFQLVSKPNNSINYKKALSIEESLLEFIQGGAPILHINREWAAQLIKAKESDTEQDMMILAYKKKPKVGGMDSKFFNNKSLFSDQDMFNLTCDKYLLTGIFTKKNIGYNKNLNTIKKKFSALEKNIFVLNNMRPILPFFHPEYTVGGTKKYQTKYKSKRLIAKNAAFIFPYYKISKDQHMKVEFIFAFWQRNHYLVMKTVADYEAKAYFNEQGINIIKTKEEVMEFLYKQSFIYLLINKENYDTRSQWLELPFHCDPKGVWETPQEK